MGCALGDPGEGGKGSSGKGEGEAGRRDSSVGQGVSWKERLWSLRGIWGSARVTMPGGKLCCKARQEGLVILPGAVGGCCFWAFYLFCLPQQTWDFLIFKGLSSTLLFLYFVIKSGFKGWELFPVFWSVFFKERRLGRSPLQSFSWVIPSVSPGNEPLWCCSGREPAMWTGIPIFIIFENTFV